MSCPRKFSFQRLKERYMLALVLIFILLIDFGWLTKDTFHYEKHVIPITNGDYQTEVIMKPNMIYSGDFQVKWNNLAEIRISLINSWEITEDYTVAIETKDGDIIATTDGSQLARNNDLYFLWDIYDVDLNRGENYKLCIYTGDFSELSVPIIRSISCGYGRNYHSNVRYLLFVGVIGLSVLWIIIVDKIEDFMTRVLRKRWWSVIIWVLYQLLITLMCINGFFLLVSGSDKQRVGLLIISIFSIGCAIGCYGKKNSMIVLCGVLPFIMCWVFTQFGMAQGDIAVPFWVIVALFWEIMAIYYIGLHDGKVTLNE